MDAGAYLRRIRYDGRTEPTAETLRALHVAHLVAVPFENLSIHIGEPIVLDDAALFEKIVIRRRGGFCYELNGLFAALLRAFGFDVSLLSARARGTSGEFGPEFDHMALLVRLDEPWLADVGFGDCFLEPIRLGAGASQPPGWHLSEARGEWLLSRVVENGGLRPQYRFTLAPRATADFAGMCAFHQTSPDSPFTQRPLCTLATPDGRVTLTGFRLVTTRGGIRSERGIQAGEYEAILRETFGIELPAGGRDPLVSVSRRALPARRLNPFDRYETLKDRGQTR